MRIALSPEGGFPTVPPLALPSHQRRINQLVTKNRINTPAQYLGRSHLGHCVSSPLLIAHSRALCLLRLVWSLPNALSAQKKWLRMTC